MHAHTAHPLPAIRICTHSHTLTHIHAHTKIGIPLCFLLWLSTLRSQLNPPGKLEDRAIEERLNDKALMKEPIANFALHYRPQYWWYEVYALSRRLSLTSVPLAFEDLGSTTIFVLSLSIVTLVIEKESFPHVNPFLSAFTYVLVKFALFP